MPSARRAFCSTMTSVTPCRLISAIRSKMASTNAGARPAEGSSRRRISGSGISARAIASIWRSPPLIVPAVCLRRSPSLGKSSYIALIRLRAVLRSSAPICRLSSTVSDSKTLSSWGT
jgi:hypothetical protein